MKTSAARGAALRDVDLPRCGPDDLLLKVRAASICGTDLHIYSWNAWAERTVRPPLVFGHELAGEVVEAGRNVRGFRAGDGVSVESHVPCGRCYQCEHDLMHICDNLEILGVHRPGAFAEYVAIPAICAWKNLPGTTAEVATVLEPMGNAVHAVSEAGVENKAVAVFGCGPTGLFTVAAAKAMGASSVYAVDVNRTRLAMAGRLGADELFEGADPDVAARLAVAAGGHGLDVAFDMSGSPAAITHAIRSLRKGGTFVAFGLPKQPAEIDLANEIIMKGRRILGIVGRHMFETWRTMERLLESGRLDPARVVTHRYGLSRFEEAFETLTSPDHVCGKIVMFPSESLS
jgi:threonine 3-dehydrogenase